jgi:cytochrome c oxidase assembly protein subunit 15
MRNAFRLTVRRYRTAGTVTIVAVYFLIFVGGVVRATGAGMGCPDWPKCFGRWVPPVHESQLPPDYQEIYAHRGYADTTFNPVKTWTEYINRLIGVLIGLCIFATFVLSFVYWSSDRTVVGLSFASFLLVGFQGWLGSVVVTSNLVPVIVTLHMVVALALVCLLILALARSRRDAWKAGYNAPSRRLRWLLIVALLLSLIQVVLGAQVREQIDVIAADMGEGLRAEWVGRLGAVFYVHRSFSILVLVLNVWIAVQLLRCDRATGRAALGILAVIVVEIAVGAALYYLGMPAFLQPVHLLLASVLFGLQFHLLVVARYPAAGNAADSQVRELQRPALR